MSYVEVGCPVCGSLNIITYTWGIRCLTCGRDYVFVGKEVGSTTNQKDEDNVR